MVRTVKPKVKAHHSRAAPVLRRGLRLLGGLGRSVIALPPSPGTASALAAPALVVRLDFEGQGGVRQHVADYLSDGTVIRLSGHPFVRLQR